MSRAVLVLVAAALVLNACGYRRPLIRPADIPAYERERADKLKKYETRQADEALPAVPPATPNLVP